MKHTEGMDMDKQLIDAQLSMKHDPIRNYVIAGLTSYLLTDPSPHGCIRLFENSRERHNPVTPHSHKFDLTCLVLKGWVKNIIWTKVPTIHHGDKFNRCIITNSGTPGEYDRKTEQNIQLFGSSQNTFKAGDIYSMRHSHIHSIEFSRNAQVILFEGPFITNEISILEPYVDGEVIETMKVEPWMFKKGES